MILTDEIVIVTAYIPLIAFFVFVMMRLLGSFFKKSRPVRR